MEITIALGDKIFWELYNVEGDKFSAEIFGFLILKKRYIFLKVWTCLKLINDWWK